MSKEELFDLLSELRALSSENELVEFKAVGNNYSLNEIGKYFSALSNAANLKNQDYAWLIFGVEDKNHKIVGTDYREQGKGLDKLKHEISQLTGGFTFSDIFELFIENMRVLMFKIPSAPQGNPVSCSGHYFERNGSSLVAMNVHNIMKLQSQVIIQDWSAQKIQNATVNDLDPVALIKAREHYKLKNPKLATDIDVWDDITFLNKARITIDGAITRTAIILLGKNEATHFLSPFVAQMSWILKDRDGLEEDYQHFGPPFILNTDDLLVKIRNLNYRYMPNQSLFPIEVTKYDLTVLRESLHNCIAHQNYELARRITVIEKPDDLLFCNAGTFLPGSIDNVIKSDKPSSFYRNKFLVDAMVSLNMIDTIGSGIKRMFVTQKKRFFPLPSYDLARQDEVSVKIFGKVLDLRYTKMLIDNNSLDLDVVMLLDKVQKGEEISYEAVKYLRKLSLIEGRYPSLYVSARVAEFTESKAKYIKNKGLDDEHYKELIVSMIRNFGEATRKDLNLLLYGKLPEIMNDEQKRRKVENLLQSLKREGKISRVGANRNSKWILVPPKSKN